MKNMKQVCSENTVINNSSGTALHFSFTTMVKETGQFEKAKYCSWFKKII